MAHAVINIAKCLGFDEFPFEIPKGVRKAPQLYSHVREKLLRWSSKVQERNIDSLWIKYGLDTSRGRSCAFEAKCFWLICELEKSGTIDHMIILHAFIRVVGLLIGLQVWYINRE